MKTSQQLIAFCLTVVVFASPADGQRRGGGGRSFGGGGFSGGGGMSRAPAQFSRPNNMARPAMPSRPSMPTHNFSRPSSLPTGGFGGNSRTSIPDSSNFNNQLQNRLPSTRTPSRMPSTAQDRMQTGAQNRLPSSANRSNIPSRGNLPSNGSLNNGRNRITNSASSRADRFEKPSNNQLNDFLNIPKSSTRTPNSNTTAEKDRGGRSFEGDNFSVDTFGGKGSGSKGDVDYGGAYGGVVITDSDGNKRVVGRGVGGVTNGDGTVAGSGRVAAGSNTDGSKGINRSGTVVAGNENGVAVGRGSTSARTDGNGNFSGQRNRAGVATNGETSVGRASSVNARGTSDGRRQVNARGIRGATDGENSVVQRGAASASRDRYGNVRGAAAGSTFATDGRNVYREAGGVRGVRDPFGNVIARGAYRSTYNGIVRDSRQVVAVRRGFRGYTYYFRPSWYRRYPGAWYVSGIAVASWWYAPTYGYVTGYCGYNNAPVSYDYGPDSVYVQNGDIYYGDEVVASQSEYYSDAIEIAGDVPQEEPASADATEASEDSEDWLPLGVFAVVEEGETSSDVTLQLAVSKSAEIRGNVVLEAKDEVRPVYGNVDKETQKVAFRVEDREDIVVEAGLYNLTEDVLTVMVHFSEERSEIKGLVRLTEDDENDQPAESGS